MNENKEKFYQKKWFLWLVIICFFPAGVFLLWKYKHYSKAVRIVITVLIIGLVVFTDKKETPNMQAIEPVKTENVTSSAKESLLHKLTSSDKDKIVIDLRNGGDSSKVKHGQMVIISGEVVAGNGKKGGRNFSTAFGSYESQPFILADKNGREWPIVLAIPSRESVFERKISVKGIVDQEANDPILLDENHTSAIVKAEIIK
ncbi:MULTISPECIES: hypothetical protein [Pelosinus]|uniref:Uncharacterized protein n=1 Tax=Pelosinus fermentans B4 TaxID=1149862 RepID=I9LG83_9FIRM|nr:MULTISPECIES: hypothetical protein [Pelosinus]EIW19504.1 hypothetical protein FB4_2687 [Pelosinus fermentans B4]EIW24763.1 hypothetical protein FA11_3154 [Pelosinus fermentans A11]OAM95956.1 hypothetical protein FR7_03978 [Pelosinus fermentans DSM 17108]SDR34729.1 hypothetical protein SAMN04515679_4146 [Pelosinus fermentans]